LRCSKSAARAQKRREGDAGSIGGLLMPHHAETRRLPWTAGQMFDLVADVARYPEFLPWVQGLRVLKAEGDVVTADMIVGFKMIRERFTSRVKLDRPGHVRVDYISGPLRRLDNDWHFRPTGDGGCEIDFSVDFEFRSKMFERLAGMFFGEAFKRMVGAFEARAEQIYGRPQGMVAATSAPASPQAP
jgi:coenzyme Q-binding protein COQ10